MRRLAQMLRYHRLRPALVRLVRDTVLRQRLVTVDPRKALGVEPDGDRLTGRAQLAVDARAVELGVARLVQHPAEARGVEDAVQLFGGEEFAAHPVEHCGRAAPVLRALLLGEPIVVGVAQIVDGQRLRPGTPQSSA